MLVVGEQKKTLTILDLNVPPTTPYLHHKKSTSNSHEFTSDAETFQQYATGRQ
jgi:hypothetical protein